MPTKNRLITVMLPPEIEDEIYELRKLEEYKRCSIGEIIRRLIRRALVQEGYLKDE